MPTIRHVLPASVLILALLVSAATAQTTQPALPDIPDKKFSIADFGAKADGKTKATVAIAKALDAAEQAGGGTVQFPAGTYLTGAIKLRSKVGILLDEGATILFSTDPADYPVVLTRWEGTECMNYSGLIYGRDASDIAITGKGTIDGQGSAWWPWTKRAGPTLTKLRELGETTDDPTQRKFGTPEAGLRPPLFEPVNCQRILLDGVKFVNSPFWTLHPVYCSDITARNMHLFGTGPNTDGLNPDSCRNILIENCSFDTGDDCVTLKSGRDKDGRRVGKPTENVHVRDCTFKRGHGTVVIGSEMSGGVRNVLAENIVADGNDAGVRIKSRRGRGGVVENIVYRNLTYKNIVKEAITIDMFYDVGNNPDVTHDSPDALPVYRNILVENLKCDGAATAIRIRGLPDSPMSNIVLRNVEITGAKQGVTITNAPDTRLSDVVVKHANATTVVTSP